LDEVIAARTQRSCQFSCAQWAALFFSIQEICYFNVEEPLFPPTTKCGGKQRIIYNPAIL